MCTIPQSTNINRHTIPRGGFENKHQLTQRFNMWHLPGDLIEIDCIESERRGRKAE